MEDLILEELPQVGGHLAGKVGAVVVHGEEDAFDFQGVLEGMSDAVDGVHQFGYPFQGEEFALNGDQNGIGGDQSVEGEEVEGWRAIDQDEPVVAADFGDALAHAEFTAGDIDQFQIGADQVLIGGDDVEAFQFSRTNGLFCSDISQEHMVEAGPIRIFGGTQAAGGVSLRVGIDDEDP